MKIKMMRNILLCLSIVSVATAISEKVWLEDLNSDIDQRHLEAGLPSTLRFRLSRRDASLSDIDLNLEENTRLNPNAPVFDVHKTRDGKQKLVRKNTAPLSGMKFYRDKNVNGVFQVSCKNRKGAACQRTLFGNLNISGRDYEVQPVPSGPELPSLEAARSLGDEYVPHVLIPSGLGNDADKNADTFTDAAEIPDMDKKGRDEMLDELKSFLSNEQKRLIEKKLAMKYSRSKRSTSVYALEVLIAVDNALWERYHATTSASGGLSKDAATELRLQQHFAHIVNGASLRYESIEDPEMNIYLTLSGFLFYKNLNSTNPYPPSSNSVVDGQEYVDADSYINNLNQWSAQLSGLPHNDHIAVFTGYELYTGSVSNKGVAGKAWVKGVCNSYRTSINEDTTYFTTVSVFAHELGHNLGSSHDGSGTSSACESNDKYIMAPMVASFSRGEAYTVNPWRFSQCSINAFKSYVDSMGSGNCLLDNGDFYDEQEYTNHVALLPGQLHSPDEQCKLARGDNSNLCSSPTDEDICRVMMCQGDDGYCWFYAAARGTPCGESSLNKWCIEGLCVTKSDDHVGSAGTGSGDSNTGSNTGSGGNTGSQITDAPVQTTVNTGGNAGCENLGWNTWTCDDISTYFFDTYNMVPSQWCQDPEWYNNCCALCTATTSQRQQQQHNFGSHKGCCFGEVTLYFGAHKNSCVPSGGQQVVQTTTTTTTTTPAPVSGGDCEDTGWSCASGPWTCQEVSDYFYGNYNYVPTQWCLDPNWKTRCCQFCAGYGI